MFEKSDRKKKKKKETETSISPFEISIKNLFVRKISQLHLWSLAKEIFFYYFFLKLLCL